MTKEHKRICNNSFNQMRREDEIQEKLGAALAGFASWIIWFAIFFA